MDASQLQPLDGGVTFMSNQTAAPAAAPAATGMSMIYILAFVLVVFTTILECLAAYVFIPAQPEAPPGEMAAADPLVTEALEPEHHAAASEDSGHGKPKKDKEDAHGGDAHGADAHGGDAHGDGKTGAPVLGHYKREAGEPYEFDLGEYRVTAYQPATNTTLRIDFHIFGVVPDGMQGEFTSTLEVKRQRLRDQVITIVRSIDMPDFTEAGLGLIKRRILETSNKTFGKPYLQSIIFSEFSFIEQ